MMGRRETLVGVVGALLLASATGAVVFAQAPATKAPAAAAAPAAAPRFVTPLKGEAQVQILNPQSKQEGNMLVTRIKVKNISKGPLVGFKADEYWYNAKGETISAAPSFRHLKPFRPNEVIEVLLRSPWNTQMTTGRSLRVFAHGNGSVKAALVPKFKADS